VLHEKRLAVTRLDDEGFRMPLSSSISTSMRIPEPDRQSAVETGSGQSSWVADRVRLVLNLPVISSRPKPDLQ
jgi:hypothetical protein